MKLSDEHKSFLAGLTSCFEKAKKGYTSGTPMGVLIRAARIYEEITGEYVNVKCGACIISMLIKLEKITNERVFKDGKKN